MARDIQKVAKDALCESRSCEPRIDNRGGGKQVFGRSLDLKENAIRLHILRKTKDLDQAKCIEDEDGKVLIMEANLGKMEELFSQVI